MNELSKNLKAIFLRNGVVIWKEADRMDNLASQLMSQDSHNFIKVDENIINSADVLGIFDAQTMEEWTRRQNGEWQCKYANWHQKRQKCECRPAKRCRVCGEMPSGYREIGSEIECLNHI